MALRFGIAQACLLGVTIAGCSSDDASTTRKGSVTDCSSLCALQPTATTEESNCAATTLMQRGFAVLSTAPCTSINSVATCNTCYTNLRTTTADCVAVRDACVKD
jgi:hypothetical protein